MWCDAPKFENDLFLYENLAPFWRIPLKSHTSPHVKDSATYVHIFQREMLSGAFRRAWSQAHTDVFALAMNMRIMMYL